MSETSRSQRWAHQRNTEAFARYQAAEAAWQQEDRELYAWIGRARTFRGSTAAESAGSVVLKRGEAVLLTLNSVTLVESARLPGHSVGGYSGFSYRLTRDLRYSAGVSRRTYVQGAEQLKEIDTGTAVVTNQRVTFQGRLKAREWAFSKLIGYAHDAHEPYTSIHVANRQNASGLRYGLDATEHVRFHLALAIAIHQDAVPRFVAQLEAQRAEHWARRPVQPVPLTAADAPTGMARALGMAKVAYTGKPNWKPGWRIAQAGVMGLLTLSLVMSPFTEPETTNTSAAQRQQQLVEPPRAVPPETRRPVAPPAPVRTSARPSAPAPKPAPPAPAPRTASAKPRPPAPAPKPATAAPKPLLSTCGAPANPWGYNFCGRGGTISDPPASFCQYFDCIASFWNQTNGYVMQCDDGMYSHSGGRSGSCSHHGGNNRPLYG